MYNLIRMFFNHFPILFCLEYLLKAYFFVPAVSVMSLRPKEQ